VEQIKIYSQQLVAEVLSQLQETELDSLPVYDKGHFIGKISYEELTAFVNHKDKSGNIYTHKLNFDIGTALFAIKRMRTDFQNKQIRRNSFHRQLFIGLGSVAAVALVLMGISWLFFKQEPIDLVAKSNLAGIPSNKIILTLSNGENIELDSVKTGLLVNGQKLNYSDGSQIGDQNVSDHSDDSSHYVNRHGHTTAYSKSMVLNVPRMGMYRLVLPDGSKVWLNSSSRLKFPTTFEGASTRRVELNGEAYFEIAKVLLKSQGENNTGRRMPFIVVTDKQEIEVLGTHFNVSAYQNEKSVKTTLVEGSVRLRPSLKRDKLATVLDPASVDPLVVEGGKKTYGNAVVLKPNEQATLTGTDIAIKTVDADEAFAWTNGEYVFRNMPLESIMRMITRWYDVDVVYKDNRLGETLLGGSISKSSKINNVLEMLELSANVHFKIKGRRITVIE
jgi:transmembrane sensor